jgi:hypothetical protein
MLVKAVLAFFVIALASWAQAQDRTQYFNQTKKDLIIQNQGTVLSNGTYLGDTPVNLDPVYQAYNNMNNYSGGSAINQIAELTRQGYSTFTFATIIAAENHIVQGASTAAEGMTCNHFNEQDSSTCDQMVQEGMGVIKIGTDIKTNDVPVLQATTDSAGVVADSTYGGEHSGAGDYGVTYINKYLKTYTNGLTVSSSDTSNNQEVAKVIKKYNQPGSVYQNLEKAKAAGVSAKVYEKVNSDSKSIKDKISKMFMIDKIGKLLAKISGQDPKKLVDKKNKDDDKDKNKMMAAIPQDAGDAKAAEQKPVFRGISSKDMEGLKTDLNGAPIGVKGDDIFKIVKRRYDNCSEREFFAP